MTAIHIPPLRERREDVLPIAERAVRRFGQQMGKSLTGLSAGARRMLGRYSWPGNVRELENVIERAVALEESHVVQAESLDLGPILADHTRRHTGGLAPPHLSEPPDGHLRDTLPVSGFDLAQHVEPNRALLHDASAGANRWSEDEGGGTPGNDLSLVSVLHEEVRHWPLGFLVMTSGVTSSDLTICVWRQERGLSGVPKRYLSITASVYN